MKRTKKECEIEGIIFQIFHHVWSKLKRGEFGNIIPSPPFSTKIKTTVISSYRTYKKYMFGPGNRWKGKRTMYAEVFYLSLETNRSWWHWKFLRHVFPGCHWEAASVVLQQMNTWAKIGEDGGGRRGRRGGVGFGNGVLGRIVMNVELFWTVENVWWVSVKYWRVFGWVSVSIAVCWCYY